MSFVKPYTLKIVSLKTLPKEDPMGKKNLVKEKLVQCILAPIMNLSP
jgi:hypothetical protein